MKLVPSISLITVIAAIPLAGLSLWTVIRSERLAADTEGFIREEQLGSYHAERVATAILDCRRYEQGLLLAGPDADGREIHLAGFLWFCDVLHERHAAYVASGERLSCLSDILPALRDYRASVLRVAGRLYLENDAESVRLADADLEPFKESMRLASKCASSVAREHADNVEREVSRLVLSLRRDQVVASVGGLVSFSLLAFGITTLIVPISRRARKLAEAAKRLSDGNRGVDCRVGGNDELAQAGDALERMRLLVEARERSLLTRETEAKKLSEAIERTALPTMIADDRGAILWSNRAAANLMPTIGATPTAPDLSGVSLQRLLRTIGYTEQTVLDVLRATSEGQPFSGERESTGPEGERSWRRLEGYPVRGNEGGPERGSANFVILERDVSDARRMEASREAYAHMITMLMGDRPLEEVLDAFARHLETTISGVAISVVVLEGDRLSMAAAPSLPVAFSRLVEGLLIGPDAGSCGRCAYTGETVIADDTSKHEAWARYRGVAEAFGIAACWSLPVRSVSGELLGTLAAYAKTPRSPRPDELAMLRVGAGFAGLALGRRRADARAEQALLELSEARAEVDRLRRDALATNDASGREAGSALAEVRVAALRAARAAGRPGGGFGEDLLALIADAARPADQPAVVAGDSRDSRDSRTWEPPLQLLRAALAAAREQFGSELEATVLSAAEGGAPELVLIDAPRTCRLLSHIIVLLGDMVATSAAIQARASAGAPHRPALEATVGVAPSRERGGSAHTLRCSLRAPTGWGDSAGEEPGLFEFTIARRAVQRIGGSIGVRAEQGEVIVHVELPCEAMTPGLVRADVSASSELDGAGSLRGRVLLVDDHADIRSLFALYLRRAGAEVDECESGVEALERMLQRTAAEHYDLVLLDMQLPGHDGYSVTRIARAAGCQLPIVAMTAHAIGDERSRCLATGCDDFVTKPIGRAELIAAVRHHMFRGGAIGAARVEG